MIKYKQILEAINRGILLALDDFDDEEVLNIKSKQVLNRDYTKEYLDLMKYEVVDLDLPSRTLWCKYNLDVDPNLLTKPEDWYGGYYAWGELEGNKPTYNWSNYKFGNGSGQADELTKYVTSEDFVCNPFNDDREILTLVDNLTQLQLEDDAAYQNKKFYNFKFYIPSKELCEELINYTQNYWVNNYDPNKLVHNPKDDSGIQGLNGRIFEGKNGNQLFIPAAGEHDGIDVYNIGFNCYLWSSSLSLDFSSYAYHLSFDSGSISMDDYDRFTGFSIRPVIKL